MRDLIRDAVLIQVAGFALGLVSLGLANGGAMAINVAKISAEAPRFTRMLDIVRVYADEAAAALSGTRFAMAGVGTRLRPMADARLLMSAEVDRVGAKLARVPSFLGRHEGGAMKAHTMERHVAKTNDYLRRRILDGRKRASTFTDEASGEQTAKHLLSTYDQEIKRWLANDTQHGLPLEGEMASTVGRIVDSGGSITETNRAKMVLVQDATMPEGYRILTMHPIP